MSEERYVGAPEDDGSGVEAQLTVEGVIVDRYDRNGECVATFGRTYDELVPVRDTDNHDHVRS